MSKLQFNNKENLKFYHDKNGVIAVYKKKTFMLGFQSIAHKDKQFSKSELLSLAHSVLSFECVMRGLPVHSRESESLIMAFDLINDFTPFYKYVSNDIFNNYIKKGKWQLGCISQYRTIENKKQRDEFEGFSFLHFNLNNQQFSSVCNAGFNYLIFCGTKSENSLQHKKTVRRKAIVFSEREKLCREYKKIYWRNEIFCSSRSL